ncbi:MAG: lysylphosphatidylglycerol synthase transmembrane domain-containing protein [Kiritimatiellia bacterium]
MDPTQKRDNTRRIVMTGGAIALAVVLMGVFIYRSGNIPELLATVKSAFRRPGFLICGTGLFSVSLMCGMLRWHVLLRTLKLPISFGEAFRLYATGHFFNVIGPGATGGDVVKGAWIAAKCAGRRTEAITSIAAERLIGLIAMVVFVTTVSVLRADFFTESKALTLLRHAIYWACATCVVVILLLTAINWERLANRLNPQDGSFIAKVLKEMINMWRTFHVCLTHPIPALLTFLLSIANHITDVCCYFLLSRAIGMTIRFKDLIVISPLANTIAAVPLTPGGAGVRENTLQYMMDVVSIPRTDSTALGLLMFGTIVFWALIAGVIMASGVGKTHIPRQK